MDMQTFASRLRAIREERNVSVTELAEHLGVNKTTVYRYETGAFNALKADSLIAIAEYLQVNPDYLTGGSDNKHAAKGADGLQDDTTDAEKMLLELFRKLPADEQSMALDVLRAVLKRGQ